MPRLLAIEWDDGELRAVVATAGGGRVEVERAVAVSLADEANVAERLKAWLAESGVGKVPAMVAVGGSRVELHEISLPPAPAEELPDLVRFQVQREVTTLEDNDPLDFVVLSGDFETPYHILAAIIPATALAEAREVCHTAGVRLSRMALRPCATASLADQSAERSAGVHLIVHPMPNEVDIVAMIGGAVQLIRTVRLPGGANAAGNPNALIGEVRRTIASVRQQLGEQGVDRITVCGGRVQCAALATQIGKQLDMPTAVFDPREAIETKSRASVLESKDTGEFAPLIGMLHDAAHDRSPTFDFVHPRQRTKERPKTRLYALAAAVLLLLVAWYGFWQYGRFASVDRSIESAQEQLKDQQLKLSTSQETEKKAERIARWLTTDVTWLDELDHLSQSLRPMPLAAKEYPADQDIVVTQLRLEGRQIELDAVARSREVIPPFEKRFRDSRHSVEVPSGDAATEMPGFQWDFKATVTIETTDVTAP